VLYVFDRATGAPIWPIEEKPVPLGDVPGEKYSPTQPMPSKPPSYGRNATSVSELIDFTPQLRAEAEKLAARYKMGPLFTPPVLSKVEGPLGTLVAGCCQGGTGWPGGSYDPATHILYAPVWEAVNPLGIITPKTGASDMAYISGIARDASGESIRPPLTVQGLPLFKPPYAEIVAIDLDKGDIAWRVAHGETPDDVRNNPALKGITIPRTGRGGLFGVLTTSTLVIAGERGTYTDEQGRNAARLRAYDKATGKEVGAVFMPTGQTGSPMTYMLNGKQYIVIAIGGPNYPGELVAYKLPE
jgi:quinoprotein glucose dehydrogenase